MGKEGSTIQPIINPKGFSLLNEFRITELPGITQLEIPLSWPWPLMLAIQVIVMSVSYVWYNFRAFEPRYSVLRDRVELMVSLMLWKAIPGILRYPPY